MALAVNNGDHFPQAMLNKSVCVRTLDGRYMRCGSRLSSEIVIVKDTNGPYSYSGMSVVG